MWLHGQHEDMVFQEEFIRWKMFCEYREIVRASPTRFAEYKEGVRKFLHHRAIEWTVELQEDLLIQSKLDEWKEYYIYVCGKLQERRIREAEKQVFCCRKELKAAKANGLHNANFSSWHDPQRLESALKELKAALSNGGDRLVKEQDKQDTKLVLNGSVGTDWDWLHEARRSWNPPYNVLEQMKGEFPKILAEMELTRRDQAESPNSKRSSSGAVSKAAQPRLSQRDTRHRGKRSILQAVLEPVRPSRVSKTRGGKHSLNQGPDFVRYGCSPPKSHAGIKEKKRVQPEDTLRRSQRILERASGSILPHRGSDRLLTQAPPFVLSLRRSVRIRERLKKLQKLPYGLRVDTGRSNTATRQQSARRSLIRTNAECIDIPHTLKSRRSFARVSEANSL